MHVRSQRLRERPNSAACCSAFCLMIKDRAVCGGASTEEVAIEGGGRLCQFGELKSSITILRRTDRKLRRTICRPRRRRILDHIQSGTWHWLQASRRTVATDNLWLDLSCMMTTQSSDPIASEWFTTSDKKTLCDLAVIPTA